MAAPLQGHTRAAWRTWHSRLAGGIDTYCAPFVRVERGVVRPRDLRDTLPANNPGLQLLPQALAGDAAAMHAITDALRAQGHSHVDLNMGCPFPPQVHHGRGSSLILQPRTVKELVTIAAVEAGMTVSVKMRLGTDGANQWRQMMETLNSLPLTHVTLHPRTARQQYGGPLDHRAAREFIDACRHPVIWSGDIATPADIDRLRDMYPRLAGVMTGRGLLARPTLAREWRSGTTATPVQIFKTARDIHDNLLEHYRQVLAGDTQVLANIKPYWQYMEPLIGHKTFKAISKATVMDRYLQAVAQAAARPAAQD